ncbi:MAG TPA: AAA family ATPase [Acidimicrobiales bacterium]|nr:AAA family ATPase [Acidimicrobiales bacterium]
MALLERDAEMATLSAHWQRARRGNGSVVLVRGESGIGKTTVVRAFVDDAADGARVLWGSCDPLTTPRPMGPLHDVAEDIGGRVRDLLGSGGFSHEISAAMFDELRAAPHVLVIDDLHWADEATLDLIRFLLRRIGATPSLVIGTFRNDEIGSTHPLHGVLGDVARNPNATCLRLCPLSISAIRTMIGSQPVDAAELLAITGGNCFFVNELLSHEDGELPTTVRDAVLARTAILDEDARELLDVLACSPEAIPDRALPALGVGILPLRALAETGLVERGRRGVTFRHEMCRLAVASAIPPGGEVALHLRMIDALESVALDDPALLAHHAVQAGDTPRILRYSSLAGIHAARTGAHTQAATFFETALTQGSPPTAAEQAELLELLAAELYLTNHLEEAIRTCERAIALRAGDHDLAGVGANHHALSMYEWYNANRAVAERHASTAIEFLEPSTDPVRLGHAYAAKAYLAFQANDLTTARLFHARARDIAAGVRDRALDARLEIMDAAAAYATGDGSGRARILSAIEDGFDQFDELYSSGYSNLVYLDVEQRRLREAAEVLEVSLPLTVERDTPICHSWQLGARGRLMLLRGDWDAALTDAQDVLDSDTAALTRTWPHLVRGLVALRRGGPVASADLDAAWTLANRFDEPLRLLPAASALAEQSWHHRRDDARLADAATLPSRFRASDGTEWSTGDLLVWLRRAGVDVVGGDTSSLADPHRLLLSGDPHGAAAAWAELDHPYDQALALVDTGEPDDTFMALELLDRLGADAVAARVRQDLRDAGVRGIPGRRRATTRSNPAGLTARQVEVLRLLGEGLTNAELAQRLYISSKTADHHVSAILTKLGVDNRRAAAAAARQLGLGA